MIEPIKHYSISNPATAYDEDSLTVLQLCGRLGYKVNEIISLLSAHDTDISSLKAIVGKYDMTTMSDFVNAWLTEHPEDEANMGKLITGVLGYVTPQMFGAKADNTTDDTEAIKKAISFIGPGCRVLYLPAGGYEVSEDIALVSDMTLRGDGKSTVIRRVGNSLDNYAIIDLTNVNNVTVENLIIQGERHSHTGATGEWGMGLQMKNANYININNVSAMYCWGDGVYIGSNEAGQGCSNIRIENCHFFMNRRNGMGVVNADAVFVKNTYFTTNTGTAPQAGICFEPNKNGEKIDDVIVESCFFRGNNIDIDATVHKDANIKIVSCHLESPTGFAFNSSELTGTVTTPQIVFDGCEFYNAQNCVNLYRKNAASAPLTFRGCQLSCDNVCVQIGAYGLDAGYNYGGIFFYGCQIKKNSASAGSVRFQLGADSAHKLVDSAFQLHYDTDIVPWFYFTIADCEAVIDVTGGKAKEVTSTFNLTKNNLYPVVASPAGQYDLYVYLTTECPVGMSIKLIHGGDGEVEVDGKTVSGERIINYKKTSYGWLKGV